MIGPKLKMNNTVLHPINSIFIDRELCTNQGRGNNTFNFTFTRNVTTTNTSRMSVSNFSVPYSWFNITAKLGNNTMGYVWFDATSSNAGDPDSPFATGKRYWIVIPDGFYDLPTLNSYLQFCMIQNGHYLIDGNGNYVYFLQFVQNLTVYREQIVSYQLPNSLAGLPGWTAGAGVHFAGANAFPWPTPKFTLINTGLGTLNLFTYFGFTQPASAGYPIYRYIPDASHPNPPVGYYSTSVAAESAPMATSVHSVCLTCSLIDNPLRATADHTVSTFVVTTQNVDVKFGNDIANSNFFTTWIPLLGNQTVQSLKFQLLDQEGNLIDLQDSDTNIELLLTDLRY